VQNVGVSAVRVVPSPKPVDPIGNPYNNYQNEPIHWASVRGPTYHLSLLCCGSGGCASNTTMHDNLTTHKLSKPFYRPI
jgi:hypothetical protein